MNKPFKIGDRVYSDRFGYGEVKRVKPDDHYPIGVKFGTDGLFRFFTEDGRLFLTDPYSSLLHEADHRARILAPKERVILVSQDGVNYYRRVLLLFKNGKAICWYLAETIKEAKNENSTTFWNHWKEIDAEMEQVVELTLRDISEGKGTGVPAHLIRIKE